MRGVTKAIAEACKYAVISTHTPHARRDGVIWCTESPSYTFQLTRLMRGVTCLRSPLAIVLKYFNSHASCEA